MARSSLTQRLAASALLAACERICASHRLPEAEENQLRGLVASVRGAEPRIPARRISIIPDHDFDPDHTRTLETLARELGA